MIPGARNPEHGLFRNPMDVDSITGRLEGNDSAAYYLACRAAGHQSAFTVDKLAQKLRPLLPYIVASLAAQVERENDMQTLAEIQRFARHNELPVPQTIAEIEAAFGRPMR